jgi:hypothetical protein
VVHPHPRSAEILAASASEPLQIHHRARKIASRSSRTRPLPPPYSKEELALLNFVQQHPNEAAKIAEAQKQEVADASKPIAIPPIQSKPRTIAALN